MKRLVTLSILLLMGLIGYFVYHELHKKAVEPQIPPTVVEAGITQQQNWNVRIPTTGTLVGSQGITLQSAVSGGGVITGIFFRSGQYVKAGQPLFQINPGQNRTIVTAPFSGRVGLKDVNLGSYVVAGADLVTLQDSTPLKVDFSIPQSYLADVSIGDTALVNVNTYPGQTFQGQVYAINAALSPDTRTIEMWASIPNTDQKLLPGMFANITLVVARQIPLVVVPKTAVVYSDSGNYVFVIKNGLADKTNVTINTTVGDQIGISKGLKGGEQIVTNNTDALDDGWPVIVKK